MQKVAWFLFSCCENLQFGVESRRFPPPTLSLDKLLADPSIPFGYKLTGGNVGVVGKKVTMPHYMAMFLQPAQ